MSIFKSFFNISLSIFLGVYPYIPHFEENFERFGDELLLYHYSKIFCYRYCNCIRVIPCILQNLLFYLFQQNFRRSIATYFANQSTFFKVFCYIMHSKLFYYLSYSLNGSIQVTISAEAGFHKVLSI